MPHGSNECHIKDIGPVGYRTRSDEPSRAAAPTPMNSLFATLAAELLTKVFAATLPDPYQKQSSFGDQDSMRVAPHNLSPVCRHWRRTVLSSSNLWSQWSYHFQTTHRQNGDKVRLLLGRHVDLSRDAPMLFYIALEDSGVAEQAAVLFLTQHRWHTASLCEFTHSLDAIQLARAPLVQLQLSSNAGELTNLSRELRFPHLTFLDIHGCNQSFLSLVSLAPNLEEVNLDIPRSIDGPLLSACHEHLLRLSIISSALDWNHTAVTYVSSPILDALTCPALRELHVPHVDPLVLNSFIQRGRPPLISLLTTCLIADDLLPSLTLLPSLLRLKLFAEIPNRFIDDMGARDGTTGRFLLCPLLKDVLLHHSGNWNDLNRNSLASSIASRWHTPHRAITTVQLRQIHECHTFTSETMSSRLPSPWASLASCIEEGLKLEVLVYPRFRAPNAYYIQL